MKRLLLVDGHSLIYRSFFAFIRQPLRNSQGRNTSAVFGFANTLRKLLKTLEPEYCAVVFDAPGKTFRHERFAEYKIQRPPAPEELPEQIPIVKEMVKAWNLRTFEIPGVEADDVLATLARKFAGQGFEVVIATSDKDLLQMVGGPVTTYDPWLEKRFGPEEVKEKLGVGPELVADYLTLTGDSSDNIPGVPGIGPKRALEILTRYGTFEQALAGEPRLRGKEQIARLSRDLVQIHTDVDVDATPDALRVGKPDTERLRRVFEDMGFESLLKELGPAQTRPVEVVELKAGALVQAARIAFRFEPGSGLWFSEDGKRVVFLPEGRREEIARVLAESKTVKAGLNLKQQAKKLHEAGLELAQPVFDVGVGAWLIDPNRRGYEIEDLGIQLLGQVTLPAGPEQEPVLVLDLFRRLEPELGARGLERLAQEMEMPLVLVLAEMEERGIKVDIEYLRRLEKELSADVAAAQSRIWQHAGMQFNIGSTRQLAEVLFEKLKLPKGRRTKTGFSTDSGVLEELASQHPIVQEILQFRELTKLCNTYIVPLMQLARPGTQRIHCEFNQTGTGTGRLSSSNPNLQNVPIRTELGRKIRRAFIAEPGMVLISADYSQIELRVLAHVTGDEELKKAFLAEEDIHVRTAAAIFEVAPEAVTPEQRRMAKVVNYGLIYGMGDYGLSWRMGIPIEQARGFMDEYLGHFAQVSAWREHITAQVQEQGFVRTIAGRIRPLPGIASSNRNVADAARRAALNAPIQGSAADIMKQAMLNLSKRCRHERLNGGMVVQVHDELLVEVDEDQAEGAKEIVRDEMENAWPLDVPLVVDVGVGRNWGEAH